MCVYGCDHCYRFVMLFANASRAVGDFAALLIAQPRWINASLARLQEIVSVVLGEPRGHRAACTKRRRHLSNGCFPRPEMRFALALGEIS